MRNMRGAFSALLLAGAAYAWKNRDKLSQQFGSLRNQYGGNAPASSGNFQLPDLSATEQRDFTTRQYDAVEQREVGGTSM